MDNLTIDTNPNVILIGGGIMSATLGTFLKILQPDWKIQLFERLDKIAVESSDAWNNAGTGHSALCELNYTPQKEDGSVDTSKAQKIIEQFEVSKQFWSYLLEKGLISDPQEFIRTVPHMSFVQGADNVEYLKKRFEALQQFQLFQGMEFSADKEVLKKWIPLMMEGRSASEPVAATHMELGTDVNFGALTRMLVKNLESLGVEVHTNCEVSDITQLDNGKWRVAVDDLTTAVTTPYRTDFVFIGAGGGSLNLLQKSGIPEGKIFGGFPVGGQWLVCDKPAVVEKHHAKVYGKASVGAPPMSVPHLDTRLIDGKQAILFGPFAGFSTKFLKYGHFSDLFKTITFSNIFPMMKVGLSNFSLEKYLIQQLKLSFEDRVNELRAFYPEAKDEDWRLEIAGQRVQIIKNDPVKGGTLQFGTEVVTNEEGSLSALLGASPGASTSVSIMLNLLEKCFPEKVKGEWAVTLKKLIPSYGQKLEGNEELVYKVRNWTSQTLRLDWKQPEPKTV